MLYQVEYVQELACIASCKAEQGRLLAYVELAGSEYRVFLKCAGQQPLHAVGIERLKSVDLCTRQERPYDLERGILCRGSYQRHCAPFYGSEKGILLRLVEAVDFIDKQDGSSLREHAA